MDAALHLIQGLTRRFELGPTSFDNFALGPGEAVSSRVALEPGWTIYCVDVALRKALFLQIPLEADLAEAPFVFLMQERLARRALVVPFTALAELAEALPGPKRVVLVFNIARCGSTLINAMLNGVEGVWSLSEPDPFFDLVRRQRPAHTVGVKFRSESLFQAEQFHAAMPEAAYVFLYRDALSWARSFWYFLQNLGIPRVLDGEMLRFHWWMLSAAADPELLRPFLDPDGSVPVERTLGPGWAMHIEEYQRLLAAGVPFLAVSYAEIQSDPAAVMRRVVRHSGLPDTAVERALQALGRDSQGGTGIGRDRRDAPPFGAAEADEFRGALARFPGLTPDMRLPDAYG